MDSDELEYIEDSEPERWEQQRRTSSSRRSSREAPSGAEGVAVAEHQEEVLVIPESPSVLSQAFTSTSRFFVAPTSPTKRRRLPDPQQLGATRTASASPPPLSRKISLSTLEHAVPAPTAPAPQPLTFPPLAQPQPQPQPISHARADSHGSNSSSSAKRKSDPTATGEKKPKKRHSQITSAAALLREQAEEISAEKEVESVKAKGKGKVKEKKKEKKAIKRLSISSGSSVEVQEEVQAEVEEQEAELEGDVSISSDGIIVPPRLSSSTFHRAMYGLPPLVVKDTKPKVGVEDTSKAKLKSKSKSKAKEESDGSGEDAELTAADRLRGGLSKFKYGNDQSKSKSTSTSTSKSASRSTSVEEKEKPSTSTSTSTRIKPSPTPIPPPPPLTLPSDDRLKVLDGCPLCSHAWTAHKTPSSKAIHLRKCALEQDYTTETVRILIERRILEMAHRVELEQREVGMRRTAFERAVGVGEGTNSAWKEVRVVGIEGVAKERKERALVVAQRALDDERRKKPVEKVVKVAREIKKERKEEEERKARERAVERVRKMEKEEEEEEEEDLPAPRGTGLLGPQSTGARKALYDRAGQVLDDMGGTGLTQLPSCGGGGGSTATSRKPSTAKLESTTPALPSTYFPTVDLEDPSDDLIILDDSTTALSLNLPSTQPFEPSKLARQYFENGETEVMILPAAQGKKGRGRKRKSEEAEKSEDEEEEGKGSLWRAAAMKDDETIRRLVFAPPPSPPLPRFLASSNDPLDDSMEMAMEDGGTALQLESELELEVGAEGEGEVVERMRTLGLGGREGGEGEGREEEEIWIDEEADEGVLVWEGGDGGAFEEMERWRDDEGVISSEEEPLAEVSRRLSTSVKRTPRAGGGAAPSSTNTTPDISPIKPPRATKTKTKPKPATLAALPPPRRRASSHSVTSPSSSSSVDDDTPALPPGMPDYSSLPIADLQKQVTRYGFRISKERSVLVDQLTQVWVATHPQTAGKKKVAGEKKKATATAKGRKKMAVVEQEEGEEEAEIESLGERLRTLLVGEEEMYLKILRYEPIFFDEIVSLAATNGVKCAKPILMRFLDEQSITFFTQDPTNGTRKRYK